MNIFLLEDDEAIGIGLKYSLENEGYTIPLRVPLQRLKE